jgi:RNA polymerase sigma factor (TIGR02999 family)
MRSAGSLPGITRELQRWSDGDKLALEELLPLVYDELHRQASRYLSRERLGHTLQTTALISEAYVRLTEQKAVHWRDRVHFFGIASRLMREILIDHARKKHREKREGHRIRVSLDEGMSIATADKEVELLALDEALMRLSEFDERQSRVVEMKFFAGLNIDEIAEALGISSATVKREWHVAKAWLHKELYA